MKKVYSRKVFIIDDDPFCVNLIQQNLHVKGYSDVSFFLDPTLAIAALADKPEIVILDYTMCNMNGLEVLKKIKLYAPNAQVIFLSSQEDVSIAIESMKMGASTYIIKDGNFIENILISIEKIERLLKEEAQLYYQKNRYKIMLKNIEQNQIKPVVKVTKLAFSHFFTLLIGFTLLLSSCKVNNLFSMKKNVKYTDFYTFYVNTDYQYTIKKDDKLSLSVWDHDDLSVGSIYGIYNSNEVYGKWQLVDVDGKVAIPQIGDVKLENLTVKQAEDTLKVLMAKYIRNPILKLKVLNKEISILGEVRNPGKFVLEKERVYLLDVISLAGNFEFYADLKHVKVVRNNEVGPQGFCADLTDMESIAQNNIQILPGDIVYIPAKNGKITDRKLTNLIPITNLITTVGVWTGFFMNK